MKYIKNWGFIGYKCNRKEEQDNIEDVNGRELKKIIDWILFEADEYLYRNGVRKQTLFIISVEYYWC